MRIALGVEYDGSGFRGWQSQQEGVHTVQGCLETALGQVANHPVRTVCAGRTDTGVHAVNQVAHFDTQAQRSPYSWVMGANSNLPAEISVLWAQPVSDCFHARFSAVSRRYRYVILNRPCRSALCRQRAAWYYKPLNEQKMQEAGCQLLGEHDFSAFRGPHCQAKSPVRRLTMLEVTRQRDFVILEVAANAFLHHMVRNIAGVLLAIGSGERPVPWALEVLAGRDRTRGGVTAPPEGLYLLAVDYPEEFSLPESLSHTVAQRIVTSPVM